MGKRTTAVFAGDDPSADTLYEVAPREYVTITANDAMGEALDTRSADYPTSSVNRALVHYALRHSGVTSRAAIVTGLPVDRFYIGAKQNLELIEAKRENLLAPIRCVADVPAPTIEQHKVLSEAVAAYFDARYHFDGTENEDFADVADYMPVAVVDVGGRTTDIAVVKEGGVGLYSELSGTAEIGALSLYDRINLNLKKAFDVQSDVPFSYLQRAIETGNYILYGERKDVSQMINEELEMFAEQVGHEVSKRLGDASKFGRTIFVGGGAVLLKEKLKLVFRDLPPKAITIPEDPGFANARGMAKAAAGMIA